MAYHGSGSHSPGYDDGHRLQDVPASQVRGYEEIGGEGIKLTSAFLL